MSDIIEVDITEFRVYLNVIEDLGLNTYLGWPWI